MTTCLTSRAEQVHSYGYGFVTRSSAIVCLGCAYEVVTQFVRRRVEDHCRSLSWPETLRYSHHR